MSKLRLVGSVKSSRAEKWVVDVRKFFRLLAKRPFTSIICKKLLLLSCSIIVDHWLK